MRLRSEKRSIPTLGEIEKEWDALCFERDQQLKDQTDISYQYVTTPYIIKTLQKVNAKTALEIGCGTGRLAKDVLKTTSIAHIDAVDLSPLSIDLAQQNISSEFSISYKVVAAEQLPNNVKYDVCFSNMVFMDDPHFSKSIRKIASILKPMGSLVFTITHPCFWPYYWAYDRDKGFDYLKEQALLSGFRTSMTSSIGETTHIHRPLEYYIRELVANHFLITDLSELRPSEQIMRRYKYNYPRFLGITAQKIPPLVFRTHPKK